MAKNEEQERSSTAAPSTLALMQQLRATQRETSASSIGSFPVSRQTSTNEPFVSSSDVVLPPFRSTDSSTEKMVHEMMQQQQQQQQTSSSSNNPFATSTDFLFKSSDSMDARLAEMMQSKNFTSTDGVGGVLDEKHQKELNERLLLAGVQSTDTFKSTTMADPTIFRSTGTSTGVFHSSAWAPSLAPGHVDVNYAKVFPSTSRNTSDNSSSAAKPSQKRKLSLIEDETPPPAVLAVALETKKPTPASTKKRAAATNKKRSNNKNKKREALPKVFIQDEPNPTCDVLMGRGGRTNHWPGNERYLQEKLKIQPRYLAASKEDKTGISQELVDAVHSYGGRFLKLHDEEKQLWYEVDNTTARKKASQTLREINTAEVRAQKRAKYAKKKK